MNAINRGVAILHGRPADNMELSDEALVQQAVGLNDSQAFEQLMRRHQRRILMLLQRFCKDPVLAEDLCQETFLRAWRKLSSFDNRGAFGGWLATLAYNVFLTSVRRNKRRNATETEQTQTTPEPEVADNPAAAIDLDTLLSAVNEEEQVLLVLNYAHGLSNSEIGGILGVPEGTVKSQIHRAKQKIREHFKLGSTAAPSRMENSATGVTP